MRRWRNDSYRRNDLKVIFRVHVRVSDHTNSASSEKVQGLLGEIEKISRVPLLLVCLRQSIWKGLPEKDF